MDWKSVAEKIVLDDQNKWEQRWLAEELEVTKLGLGVWPFSDHALTQFCQKLDIPVRYFRRLPDEIKMTVANFDLRRSICRLPDAHVEMVERARAAGATAQFAGSGGAIVGTYPDEATYARVQHALTPIQCRVIRPIIAPHGV